MADRKNHKEIHYRSRENYQRRNKLIIFYLLFPVFQLSLLCLYSPASSQELKPVTNTPFARGEKFKFRAYYDSFITGHVTAGIASLEIKNDNKKFSDRNTYHVIGEGKSKGAFNFFFKVNDRFESYIDEEYLVPWYFIRSSKEGDFSKDDEVRFNQFSNTASSRTINRTVPVGIHDIISAFYFARTFDFSNLKTGDTFPITFFLDDSVYVSIIQFEGREQIVTDLGRFRCLKFKPKVVSGNVFNKEYPMDLWISDDENHIPIFASSAVIVGSVKLELISYEGLLKPLTSLIGPAEN